VSLEVSLHHPDPARTGVTSYVDPTSRQRSISVQFRSPDGSEVSVMGTEAEVIEAIRKAWIDIINRRRLYVIEDSESERINEQLAEREEHGQVEPIGLGRNPGEAF
jgi:hypothetical protein